jgi:hypothetical protein
MKTDLKVELFLIHQTYFTDNHADIAIWNQGGSGKKAAGRERKMEA